MGRAEVGCRRAGVRRAPPLGGTLASARAVAGAACLLAASCRGREGPPGWPVGVSPPAAYSAAAPLAGASDAGRPVLGPERVVATYAQRSDLGFRVGYPDGLLGALRDGSGYVLFAAGFTHERCAGTPSTQGVYRLFAEGDPAALPRSDCRAVLGQTRDGTRIDGSVVGAFDRDYAGGGPVLRVAGPDERRAVLLVYHAEFRWGPSCGVPCFYGTLGLAASTDDGASFRKLGEIVQPAVSRPAWIRQHGSDSLPIGYGPLVAADGAARAVDPATADPRSTFLYVFFPDQDPAACGGKICLAVARAPYEAVAALAFSGDGRAPPGLFRKYHDGAFTEPATTGDANDAVASGHYSPVLTGAFMPSALYDRALGRTLMATVRAHAVELRSSASLLDWSAPPIAVLDERPALEVRYPTLLGETESPLVGGPEPWLFYVDQPPGAGWPSSTLRARRLALGGPR